MAVFYHVLFLAALALANERPALPHTVEEYLDEIEFKAACHRHGMETSVLAIEPETLSNTRQFANQEHKLVDRAFLGSDLFFPAWSNRLPASVEIRKPDVEEGQGFVYRNVDDDGTGEEHHALQLSSIPGNDDFELKLSSKVGRPLPARLQTATSPSATRCTTPGPATSSSTPPALSSAGTCALTARRSPFTRPRYATVGKDLGGIHDDGWLRRTKPLPLSRTSLMAACITM